MTEGGFMLKERQWAAHADYTSEAFQDLALKAAVVPNFDDACKIVFDRLEMAAKIIEATGGRVKPKGAGSAWPAIVRTIEEIREVEAEMPEDQGERPQLIATPFEITQAEEALFWPTYLKKAQEIAAFGIWFRAKAFRLKSWQNEAIQRGFSRSTAKRRRDDAIETIAKGLILDRKPIEPARRRR